MPDVKRRKSLREQAGTAMGQPEGKGVPGLGFPEGEPTGTAGIPETPDTSPIRATHDPSPWLTQAMAEEIAESMPTGYDARGRERIPPRNLTVEEYRYELEKLVEHWGGYVWWIEGR